jgi:hypothetical protein
MTVVDAGRAGSRRSDREPAPAPLRVSDRLGAAAGAAFVACILAGNSMTESVVGTDGGEGTAARTAAGLAAQAASKTAQAGLVLELLGLLLLTWFTATVAGLGRRSPGAGPLPALVLLAGGLVAAVKLGSAAPYLAALTADGLTDEVRHALVETNAAAFVLTWLPYALLAGAAAVLLLRVGLVGRVLAGLGLVLAGLGLVVGLLGFTSPADAVPVPFLLSLLWTAAVGVRVALRGARRAR